MRGGLSEFTSRLGRPTGDVLPRRAALKRPASPAAHRAKISSAWERRYARITIVSDVVAIAIVVFIGYLWGFGKDLPKLGDVAPGVGIVAALLMLLGMVVWRAWDPRVLGQGPEEFSRIIKAVGTGAVILGLLGLALQATAARPWVFGLMPAAGILAVVFRLVLRRRLHRLRDKGECALSVLASGRSTRSSTSSTARGVTTAAVGSSRASARRPGLDPMGHRRYWACRYWGISTR